jgi:hypothetical protein
MVQGALGGQICYTCNDGMVQGALGGQMRELRHVARDPIVASLLLKVLTPKPQTPNPKPQTPNPKPQTLVCQVQSRGALWLIFRIKPLHHLVSQP